MSSFCLKHRGQVITDLLVSFLLDTKILFPPQSDLFSLKKPHNRNSALPSLLCDNKVEHDFCSFLMRHSV